MKEYIEREALKEMFSSGNKPLETAICSVIDAVPAADVAPAVRCVECKHYNTTGFPALNTGTGWCEKMDRGVSDEFFCSYGAKMDAKSEVEK